MPLSLKNRAEVDREAAAKRGSSRRPASPPPATPSGQPAVDPPRGTPSGQSGTPSGQSAVDLRAIEQGKIIEQLMAQNNALKAAKEAAEARLQDRVTTDAVEKMLLTADGDTSACELLELREQRTASGELPSDQTLAPCRSFATETGLHVGHLIARLGHVQLARSLCERHHEDWVRLVNSPTFLMKAPKRWTPLQSCMEATWPPARNLPAEQRDELMRMIVAIVKASSTATLLNTAVNGGTFVHMARGPDCLRTALHAIVARTGNTATFGTDLVQQQLINIPGKNGHSAFDIHWNNRELKEVVEEFGGISIWPMPAAHGKGKHGKAGKGTRDGLGPANPLNRQYHTNCYRR